MAGLYVHIPFCKSKCAYCDFHSVSRPDLMGRYIDAVAAEAAARVDVDDISTVYIGGGTPSMLPLGLLRRLFAALPGGPRIEYTIEVNPDDVTDGFASFLTAETPVNRVSMGVQSMVDSELHAVGRRHDTAQAVAAFRALRRGGIGNISLDLIYGLPGQTAESWRYSLASVLDLGPEHLSAYNLTVEESTMLGRMRRDGRFAETSDDTVIEMYSLLCSLTAQAGMEHYEISNFAVPQRRAIHNSAYWTGVDYIGLGTGAHSLVNGERGSNLPDIRSYIASGGRGVYRVEEESADERFNDLLITRLRTSDGLPLALTGDYRTWLLKAAASHIEAGRLRLYDDTLTIPEGAWMVSDAILTDLIVS